MDDDLRELRLRYSLNGAQRLIDLLDKMRLGELPEEIALFLAHASNAANWHVVDDA